MAICLNKGFGVKEFSNPRVLILLAVYNGRIWLEEQLKSISTQCDVTIKILISDDNSTDGSKEWLIKSMKGNDDISMIAKSKRSGSAGQNFLHLIRNCDFEDYDYIAFSDQDDVWFENKLSSGVECLQNSRACGYSSSATAFWESGKEKLITQSRDVRKFDFLFEGAGQGCTFILKQDFFSLVQKFCIENESITKKFYYHDWLVYILARSNGNDWFFDDRSFIRYRQHASNDTGARGSIEAVKSRLSLIASGWYKHQIEVALEISKLTTKNRRGLEEFENIFSKSGSLHRRLSLATFFILKGRRKTTDRLALVFSALMGWI